jgi:hypothetical protein
MIAISRSAKFASIGQFVERAKVTRTAEFADRPFHVMALAAGLICAFTLVVMFGTRPERQRALEATTRMERLATKLEHAHRIAPETAREIAQLIGQPRYSCTRMTCGDALDARNRKARIKLKMLLGNLSRSEPSARN